MKVPIAECQWEEIQPRCKISEETVNKYAEMMADGHVFPPGRAYSENGSGPYWLADGVHRALAREKNGDLDVEVDLMAGNKNVAMWWANTKANPHGMPYSSKCNERRVRNAGALRPDLSYAQLAEALRLSKSTVWRILHKELDEKPVVGRDGKTYPRKQKKKEDGSSAPKAAPAVKKQGSPTVSSRERETCRKCLGNLIRALNAVGLYDQFLTPLDQISEALESI